MIKIKSGRKVIVALLLILGISSFLDGVAGATTIGDSTFPADDGYSGIWTVTHNTTESPYFKGDKFKFTVDSIAGGAHQSVDSLIVYSSLEKYNPMNCQWSIINTNQYYLAFNETQDYLNFSVSTDGTCLAFIVPTPLNQTLIANSFTSISNETAGMMVSIEKDDDEWFNLTYDAAGVLQRLDIQVDGVLTTTIERGDFTYRNCSTPPPEIPTTTTTTAPPFNFIPALITFLIITGIAAVLILLSVKNKDSINEFLGKLSGRKLKIRKKEIKHNPKTLAREAQKRRLTENERTTDDNDDLDF